MLLTHAMPVIRCTCNEVYMQWSVHAMGCNASVLRCLCNVHVTGRKCREDARKNGG